MLQQVALKSTKRWPWVVGAIALFGAAGSTMYGIQQAGIFAEAEPTAPIMQPRTTVTALGHLEPQGEIVQIYAPTGVQETRIQELRVERGDAVQAGEVIAVLAARDRLQAAVAQAESDVRVAEAKLAQVRAGAKQGELQAQSAEIKRIAANQTAQIQAQQATIARLEAELGNAQTEANRYDLLYTEGAISASERDAKVLTLESARQNLANAQAELTRLQTSQTAELQRAQATLNQIAEVRPVDVQVAQAEVDRARASLHKAQADLEQVYVRSPQAGVVLDVYTRAGETVGNDGIIELGHTQQMVAIAQVYQSDIGVVKPGQQATVTSSALPEALHGTVERIDAKVQQQEVVNTDPSSNIDARVVEVTIRLDEASSAIAQTWTNLQVEVEIER